MKKLLMLLSVLFLVSCNELKYSAPTKASNITECDVVQSVEKMDDGLYKFKVTSKEYNFYTDKLFQVGDTLLIKVYHKNDK